MATRYTTVFATDNKQTAFVEVKLQAQTWREAKVEAATIKAPKGYYNIGTRGGDGDDWI
jgi:hypothetical protein